MKDPKEIVNLIKSRARLGDILQSKGLIHTNTVESQWACFFHGVDNKKSARYYPESDSAYCWVCKESWDIISFTMKDQGLSFGRCLDYLVKAYSIDISNLPEMFQSSVQKRKDAPKAERDIKKVFILKAADKVRSHLDRMPLEKYKKLVFGYMLLKYATSEEQFEEKALKLKDVLVKLDEGKR